MASSPINPHPPGTLSSGNLGSNSLLGAQYTPMSSTLDDRRMMEALSDQGAMFARRRLDLTLTERVCVRMKIPRETDLPFKHFHAFEMDGTVFVVVANNSNKPVMLEDDAAMFPSDSLMSKLAVLRS